MILAFDIGTTTAKAALFDRDGACEWLSRAGIPQAGGTKPLEHEIDPRNWMRALSLLTTELLRSTKRSRTEIECVVVSGNGPTLVPVGATGEPLHNAITWLDRRASQEAGRISAMRNTLLDPAYNLPKALWIKENLPAVYEKTVWFSSCPEYVCGRLTNVWITCLPAEGFQEIIWDENSIDRLGLERNKFPRFAAPGSILGPITKSASLETGLPEGVPVVLGGPDFISALVGTATTVPGRACDRAGTSEGINLCVEPGAPRDRRLLFMPHLIRPYENVSGVISTSGRAVSWFAGATGYGPDSHEEFFNLAAAAPAGAGRLIFLPYLAGERAPHWNPDARGAFIGLNLRHGIKDMARAVVESTGFAMRDVITVMESLGTEVRHLRVTGQPAGNKLLNQIKSDITGKPIEVPVFGEAELIGDLCVALVAMKSFGDIAEAAENLVAIGDRFTPNQAHKALYDDLFGAYRASYGGLEPIFSRLSAT